MVVIYTLSHMQCRQCQALFDSNVKETEFRVKIAPKFQDETHAIPAPTLCPDCRKQRRLAFRNERKLYERKCNSCQKDIISIYSSEKPQQVYCLTCWWSDKYTPTNYGQEYDFNKPFFVQYAELLKKVPLPNLVSSPDVEEYNSVYVNMAGANKNCYLIFESDNNQDSYYCTGLKNSKNCLESAYVSDSELCYECVDCVNCYNLAFSKECINCRDSYFLKNCTGCNNCLLSANLQHKEYCIANQQYTKEQYEDYLKKLKLGDRNTINSLKAKFQGIMNEHPNKFMHAFQAENCRGDYIYHSQNCDDCYMIHKGQDLMYCDLLTNARDCLDVSSFGENIERVYESTSIGLNCYNIYFSHLCAGNCQNLFYNYGSRNSQNNFGCVALKSNQYCILNKQYSAEEYELMVNKIIKQMANAGWGECAPLFLSPFAYNETVAQDYYPITKDEALTRGAKWKDNTELPATGIKAEVPSDIGLCHNEILKQIFTCQQCHKNYRIMAQELAFYKEHNLPLPVSCFACRYQVRFHSRNPSRLWKRTCAKCNVALETSYDPQKPDIVYCEKCYLETVH